MALNSGGRATLFWPQAKLGGKALAARQKLANKRLGAEVLIALIEPSGKTGMPRNGLNTLIVR